MPRQGLRKSMFCCISGRSSEAPSGEPNARPAASSSRELNNNRFTATTTGVPAAATTTMNLKDPNHATTTMGFQQPSPKLDATYFKEPDPATTVTPAKKFSPAVEPVWFVKYSGNSSSDEKKITSHQLRSSYSPNPSHDGSSGSGDCGAGASGSVHSS